MWLLQIEQVALSVWHAVNCVSHYRRQDLFLLVCSCVGTGEEFFQGCQSSAGLCYFFVGASPAKLLPIDLHLT